LMQACAPHPVLWAQSAKPGDFADLMHIMGAHPESPIAQKVQGTVLQILIEGLRDLGHRSGQPLVVTGGLGTRLAPQLPADLAKDLCLPQGRALDGALQLARGLP
jgi:glucosamine kinase